MLTSFYPAYLRVNGILLPFILYPFTPKYVPDRVFKVSTFRGLVPCLSVPSSRLPRVFASFWLTASRRSAGSADVFYRFIFFICLASSIWIYSRQNHCNHLLFKCYISLYVWARSVPLLADVARPFSSLHSKRKEDIRFAEMSDCVSWLISLFRSNGCLFCPCWCVH